MTPNFPAHQLPHTITLHFDFSPLTLFSLIFVTIWLFALDFCHKSHRFRLPPSLRCSLPVTSLTCLGFFDPPKALQEKAKWETKKASAQDQGFKTDELNLYREVVEKASHVRVLAMGSSIQAKNVYGCCEGSCKRARVDKIEELELKMKNMEEELRQYKAMKDEFEQFKATQEEVKQMREFIS
ncbi:hypothetical protein ACOSP7_013992 [Xanthoceras sorbifolium]